MRAGSPPGAGDLLQYTSPPLLTTDAGRSKDGSWRELAEWEPALPWLLRTEQARNPLSMFAGVDPAFDRLHDNPDFAALLRRVGLRPLPAGS